jgi:hypothetical protein
LWLLAVAEEARLDLDELRRVESDKDGFATAYFAYRLTLSKPTGQVRFRGVAAATS